MSMTVQVAQRGVVTLPQALRKANNIKVGDLFNVIDLGEGKFLFSRQASKIDAIADLLRDELLQNGETLESMLLALREIRENDDPKGTIDISRH